MILHFWEFCKWHLTFYLKNNRFFYGIYQLITKVVKTSNQKQHNRNKISGQIIQLFHFLLG